MGWFPRLLRPRGGWNPASLLGAIFGNVPAPDDNCSRGFRGYPGNPDLRKARIKRYKAKVAARKALKKRNRQLWEESKRTPRRIRAVARPYKNLDDIQAVAP